MQIQVAASINDAEGVYMY